MTDVVADTSPLQYLFQLGLIDLLPKLFGSVLVPKAVAHELAVGRSLGGELPDPAGLGWAVLLSVVVPPALDAFDGLGPGEREVLSLALNRPGSLAILDDRAARRAARDLGIPITGTAGILLRAKKASLVAELSPLLERLTRTGFRLDTSTRRTLLELADELGEGA